jgi:hypothetical protein
MSQNHLVRWRRWITVALLAAVAGVVLVHSVIARSDAFDVASSFLRDNPEVKKRLGRVVGTSLSWRGGQMNLSGDSGSAKFTVNVEGHTDATRVYVELRKRGVWAIEYARMLPSNGEPVLLKDVQ